MALWGCFSSPGDQQPALQVCSGGKELGEGLEAVGDGGMSGDRGDTRDQMQETKVTKTQFLG